MVRNIAIYKLLLLVVSGLLIGVCSVFGVILSQTYRRYDAFKSTEGRLRNELTEAQQEFHSREAYLNRLLDDPEFFEHVVRKRLGYSRSDELIFKFEESQKS